MLSNKNQIILWTS